MSLEELPLVGGPDLPIGVFWPPPSYETTPERYRELAATGVAFLITGNYLFERFRPDTADYVTVESPTEVHLAAAALYRAG
jgi:hypothetical protein